MLIWGIAIINDAMDGNVPWDFLVPFIGLVGVPTTCTVAEIVPKTRRSLPIFQLFYGVEAPLLTFCLLRFFWLRDLTPANTLILGMSLAGAIAFAHWLFQGSKPQFQPQWWHLAGHTVMLMLVGYLLAITAFYVPPIVAIVVIALIPASLYAIVAFPFTMLVIGFASMPIGMAVVYWQSWRQCFTSLVSRYSAKWVGAFTIAVAGSVLGLFILLQQQPQNQAFKLLEQPAQTDAERQILLQKSEIIRQGLLNAYLANYRYPYIESTPIKDIYHYQFSLPVSIAQVLQDAYDFVMAPFTYQGTEADIDRAAGLYAQFFDAPILRAEKPAIKRAIQSTFDRGQAKAGLLDIGEQRVWLANQQVTVNPQGDWADVEIHETYQNQTLNQEEILYFFSLPESAVLTGLWLNETGDRATAYPYTIAPRGAAQQVYNEEVERRVDPALLEQVGPRQYRLRAFPIPPSGMGEMHLWMTYKVLQQDGGWPMPRLSEQRNVYWDNTTPHQVNGKVVNLSSEWLPASVPAEAIKPSQHQIDLPWGAHVLAVPLEGDRYQLPQNKRLAIVLDGSRSMETHQPELSATMDWVQNVLLKQNQGDLYLTAMSPAAPQRIDNLQGWALQKTTFYGTLEPRQMLAQFQQLQGETAYDAIVLITDPGSYELTADNTTVLQMPAPLWLVHLGGLQPAYDDATLQAIQDSGGNVATTIQEAMQRLGTQPSQGEGTSLLNVVDGYAWYVIQPASETTPANPSFEPLAARQWVTHLSRYIKPDQLSELDTIHAITKDYGIVSPYSSMVVLVNEEQRQRLRELEQSEDRFNREVEDQQLPEPASAVSSVPEPGEWLLLGVVAIALSGLYYRQLQRVKNSSVSALSK
ncbi:TIGR02921 family PEP-CTERM protein [Leptolyngbya sp. PL-A3]